MSTLASLGLAVPAQLPPLDPSDLRDEGETLKRLGCLHACSASAFGFSRVKSLAWIEAQSLTSFLEEEEASFLRGQESGNRFAYQVEGIFALCWALGIEESIDWFDAVDKAFVHRLPNLKLGEPLQSLCASARMRDTVEITQAADLGYCLHWALRDASLAGERKDFPIEPYVIIERRRALEWLTGPYRWYDITLDT